MARASKRSRLAAPSFDSSKGTSAVNINPTGRAVRKCRNQPRESPFEDSAFAISDPEDDENFDELELGDVISVPPTRKRKRQHSSSPQPVPLEPIDMPSDSESSQVDVLDSPPPPPPGQANHITVHLTVNIPVGHQGPITLELDPRKFATPQTAIVSKPDKLAQTTLDRMNARSQPRNKKFAGFLDLPAELRNEIYRMIFVSERSINFSVPDNFSRSAALLRVCRQAHEEGRSILYSENRFTIERRTQRYGSFWEKEWRELGYFNVRKFVKTIGPTNTGLIRHLVVMLEDAVPCLNPGMRTNEERRFVHDDSLMSVLRHLGNHAQLQTMKLHFHGRRRVDRADDRFLDYLKRIKADSTEFIEWPPASTYPRMSKQDESVKTMLLKACTRKKKMFD